MNWLFTLSIIIVLFVVGMVFFFFMPKPQVFFPAYTDTVKPFKQVFDELKKEVLSDTSTPVIPIYGNGEIKSTKYPVVYDMLRSMPYVRYAGIINVKPKFTQKPEYGFDIVANHTIRYFYTIKQSAAQKSGIWIDGERRFFSEQEWICGDMSREHGLFNKNKTYTTTVLFIDIDRHEDIHEGRSPNRTIDNDEVLKVFFMDKKGLAESVDSAEEDEDSSDTTLSPPQPSS